MASSSMRAVVSKLPTRDDVEALRQGKPIVKGPTRLHVKTASDKADERALERWKREVRAFAKGKCLVCGIHTVKTLALDPKRGEAHHLVGREDKAVRYDPRNGVHTCLRDHGRLQRHELFIVQAARHLFRLGSTTYVNGRKPLRFSGTRPT